VEALANLGIDPKIMLAQAVNFFVLLAILTALIYRPVLAVLESRKKRIEQAEKNAKKIEDQLKKTEESVKAELQKAQAKASEILAAAKASAKETETGLVAEAKAKVAKIVEEGKADLAREQASASKALQNEVTQIVLLATEKLLGKSLTKADHSKLIAEATAELSKRK
jgi:F-type H+-transporting ATPase subunit b